MRTSVCAVLALAASAFLVSAGSASAQLFFAVGKQPVNRPTVCTQQFAPVCAVKNGMARTYSNACFARADGARVIAQGECRRRR